MTDITDQIATQAQLRLQSAALEAVANAIVITDATGSIKWVNPAFTTLTGYTVEEALDGNPRDLFHSGVQNDPFYREMWKTIMSGQTWQGQLVNRRKDGTLYDEEMIVAPVTDNQGRIGHFVAIKQDISARLQHERELTTIATVSAALRQVLSREQTLANTLKHLCKLLKVDAAALSVVDKTNGALRIKKAHGAWASISGLEIAGGAEIVAPIVARRQGYLINDVQSKRYLRRFEFMRGCRALAGFPMLVQEELIGLLWIGSTRALSETDVRLLGSMADIAATALHRGALYDRLQAQAVQITQVMQTVPEGLLVLNSRGKVLLTNPAAERLLPILTDGSEATRPQPLVALAGRSLSELLTSPPRGLRHEVQAHGRVIEILARPILNGPTSEEWVMLLMDVTEARQVQTQMQLQERLATVGQLAAGIVHAFNNIMAVINLYAEMTARSPDLRARDRERMLTIDAQAQRATALIRQILDFSRQSVLERQPLDLLALLKEQVKLLERTLPESIHTRLEYEMGTDDGDQNDGYADDGYMVSADPTRMQQIVMNLAINARDAMPEGGALTLSLSRLKVERGRSPLVPEMEAGPWICLQARDTGSGIPQEILPHIFDPFFTTKAPGKGSGLGLAQVHGIVSQYNGRIDITTAPGQGTTIAIFLPAWTEPFEEATPLAIDETQRCNGERVLLVEDNADLRDALAETLHELNYAVVEAANGQEAIAHMEQVGESIALVLSDMVMPVLGGIPMLHSLRDREWTLPAILMTGHPMSAEWEGLKPLGVSTCLFKPVQPQQLALALHEALARGLESETASTVTLDVTPPDDIIPENAEPEDMNVNGAQKASVGPEGSSGPNDAATG